MGKLLEQWSDQEALLSAIGDDLRGFLPSIFKGLPLDAPMVKRAIVDRLQAEWAGIVSPAALEDVDSFTVAVDPEDATQIDLFLSSALLVDLTAAA